MIQSQLSFNLSSRNNGLGLKIIKFLHFAARFKDERITGSLFSQANVSIWNEICNIYLKTHVEHSLKIIKWKQHVFPRLSTTYDAKDRK